MVPIVTKGSRKGIFWHTVNQSRWWLPPIWNTTRPVQGIKGDHKKREREDGGLARRTEILRKKDNGLPGSYRDGPEKLKTSPE
jgi:hypothetical protein